MRETIHRDKAGTTEYEALVRWMEPLADPTASGNLGLEGYDEFSETKTFPTREEAAAWAVAYKPETGEVNYRQVTEYLWEPDEYDDDDYGTILDATPTQQQAWWYEDDTAEWSDL